MSTFRAYLVTPPAGRRSWETVQAIAKATARDMGGKWEEVEVPATKVGLIPFLNALEARFATSSDPQEDPPAVDAPSEPEPLPRPSPAPQAAPPPPRDLTVDAIEDAIGEARGAPFGRYLTAAIARLGELGRDGWGDFQAFRNFTRDADRNQAREKRPYIPGADERGLRLLALAQIANLDDGRV